MANAGLSIGNPALLGLGIGAAPNIPSVGLGAGTSAALEQAKADILDRMGASTGEKPSIYRSADGKQYAVGGYTFDKDDFSSALSTEKFIGQGFEPTEGSWEPVDEGSYRQFLEKVKNPTMSDLFGRNYDIGVANGKQLLGSLAQFAGAEEFGGRVVASAERQQAKLEPFQRRLGSIDSAEGFGAFVVANLGQQVPNLIASLASGGAGALAGGAAAAAGRGALARSLGARLATKESRDALQKSFESAAKKYAAGEALDETEQAALRTAGRIGGAAIGAAVQNYLTGVADIYGETREQGAGADSVTARMASLLGGIPYAALETIPELMYARTLLGRGTGKTALKDIPKVRGKAGEILKRGGKGVLKGAGLEAITEAGQEVTTLGTAGAVLGFNGKPLFSDENVMRILESAAAGAATGGVLGGISNLRGPVDLTKQETAAAPAAAPEEQAGIAGLLTDQRPPRGTLLTDQREPTMLLEDQRPPRGTLLGYQPQEVIIPARTALSTEVQPEPDLRIPNVVFGAPPTPALPAPPTPPPPGTVLQIRTNPNFVVDSSGQVRQANVNDVIFGVVDNIPPTLEPGSQGLLDIFGGAPVSGEELAMRMLPSQVIPMGAPVESFYNPQQGILQFAPPAPPVSTDITPRTGPLAGPFSIGLASIPARQKTANLLAQRERELEAQRAAQREAAFPLAEAQRELQFAEQAAAQAAAAQAAAAQTQTPQPAVREPAQGQLFTRRQAPPLSAGERRRQGILDIQQEQPTVEITPAMREAQGQMRLDLGTPAQPKKKKLQKGKEAAAKKAAPAKQETKGEALKKPAAKAKPEGKQEDTKGRGRLAKERKDRNVPAKDQEASGEAGGRGGAEREITAAKARQTALIANIEQERGKFSRVSKVEREIYYTENRIGELESMDGPLRKRGRLVAGKTYNGDEIAALKQQLTDLQAILPEAKKRDTAEQDRATLIEARQDLQDAVDDGTLTPEQANDIVKKARAIGNINDADDFIQEAIDAAEDRKQLPAPKVAKIAKQAEIAKVEKEAATKKEEAVTPSISEPVVSAAEVTAVPASTDTNMVENFKRALQAAAAEVGVQQAPVTPIVTNAEVRKLEDAFAARVAKTKAQREAEAKAQEAKIAQQASPKELDNFGVNGLVRYRRNIPLSNEVVAWFVNQINSSPVQLDAKNGKAPWFELAATLGVLDQINLKNVTNVPVTVVDPKGMYSRVTNNTGVEPMGIGKIKLLVSQFVAKLKVKPTVYVYADIDALRTENPELYKRAKAARVEGDFDNTLASGYSFGKDIIIFSNNVFSTDHLNFVLTHETLGHFGLRSILSGKDFNALMESVYESSGGIRNAVDASMNATGMSRVEAVEEYLADFAGMLSNNLLARVWAAIKNALNKLGIKFSDDMARYLISQSKRYVYEGKTGNTFMNSAVAMRMQGVESGGVYEEIGRYSGKPDLRDDNQQAALMATFTSDQIGMNFDRLSSYTSRAKAAQLNFGNSFDNFKEKFFSLANFRTRENPGLSALHDVLSAGRDLAMSIRVMMNERMAVVLNRAIEGFPSLGGMPQAQYDQVNRMLYEGQRYAVSKFGPKSLGKKPLFFVNDKGEVERNQPEVDRLIALGKLSFEQMRDGFSYTVTYPKEGVMVTEKVNVDGIPGLTKDSPVWKGYLASRDSMADVELKLLQARFMSFLTETKDAYRGIAKAVQDGTLTSADDAFIKTVYDTYKQMWTANPTVDKDGDERFSEESMTKANDFIAKVNELINANESDKNPQLKDVLKGTGFENQYDPLIKSLEDFKKRFIKAEENKYIVQNKVKEVLMAELSNMGGDKFTKVSLATGYLPLLRTGQYQVRVSAFDKEGNPVRMREGYKDQLSYTQHETESDALETADLINQKVFMENGKERAYPIEVFDEASGEYKLKNVFLRAETGVVLDTVAAPPSLNLNEFIHGLNRFNIVLTPTKMEQVILALTKQDSKARKRLMRSFVPGADTDGVVAISQHIDSRASTIAKVAMRPRINELMDRSITDTMNLWKAREKVSGVPKLKYLKDQWDTLAKDTTVSPEQVGAAKRAYYEYKFMYDKTNPEGRASRENQYYNEASRLLTFLDSNKSLDESDFGAGKVVSSIRAWTSMAQLGGSLATGALNYIGAFTNSIPYLATFNEKTAFGEGFGFGNAMSAFSKALSNVGLTRAIGNANFNTATFYERVANDPALQRQYGLTKAEAEFIAQEIREGVMIPAQSNALANTARGRITSGAAQKFFDGWMWTFNSTEQAVRRALGLATFRLAYQRNIAAKMSEAQAVEAARRSAVDALRFTMGEYSVLNRPPAWRSGLQSFLYMYKVYPTTTIQTLARLSRTGQLQMLASMWLLSGIAGMPFAEDLEDLIDTIAQALGLQMASVRYELAQAVDYIAPGVSPYLLRGVVNSLVPADIASRVSTGDFLPGTEILLAGADVGQQVKDILGPSASALIGTANFMSSAISAATTEKTSLADVFRESPVTMMRALGDAFAYADSGAVLDKKGYVVTPDVGMATILARIGGFYPASASEAYETIKLTNRITDYQREVSGSFKRAWVKATISGDTEQAKDIEAAVREWNLGAKGTGLEIRDFTAKARQALREAERPAKERSLRAAGKTAKATVEELDTLLSYPTEPL